MSYIISKAEIRYKSVWTICPSTINLFCHFPLLICHQKFLFLPNCPNDECAHTQMHTSSHNAAILLPNVIQTLQQNISIFARTSATNARKMSDVRLSFHPQIYSVLHSCILEIKVSQLLANCLLLVLQHQGLIGGGGGGGVDWVGSHLPLGVQCP